MEVKQRGLVLFVGSGINARALPQWNTLLTRLLNEAIKETVFEDARIPFFIEYLLQWCKSHFDICAQASLIKYILGDERYKLEIQNALYGDHPDIESKVKDYCDHRSNSDSTCEDKNKFEYLYAVAELCSTPQVRAVITFNFDTLLETAIDAFGTKKPCAYFGHVGSTEQMSTDVGKSVIPVYHVHGLLSPPKTLLRDTRESVVFSFDEYFYRNSDPLSWDTATPIHMLRNYCTLWLGVSLNDWNMMRLLNAVINRPSEIHSYCIQCLQDINIEATMSNPKHGGKSVNLKKIAMRFQSTLFKYFGVRLIVGGDNFNSLPQIISKMITKKLLAK